jgi:hypothetical protein
MLRQSELITTMEGAISGELIHYGACNCLYGVGQFV